MKDFKKVVIFKIKWSVLLLVAWFFFRTIGTFILVPAIAILLVLISLVSKAINFLFHIDLTEIGIGIPMLEKYIMPEYVESYNIMLNYDGFTNYGPIVDIVFITIFICLWATNVLEGMVEKWL